MPMPQSCLRSLAGLLDGSPVLPARWLKVSKNKYSGKYSKCVEIGLSHHQLFFHHTTQVTLVLLWITKKHGRKAVNAADSEMTRRPVPVRHSPSGKIETVSYYCTESPQLRRSREPLPVP